jgi:hypothetical protein
VVAFQEDRPEDLARTLVTHFRRDLFCKGCCLAYSLTPFCSRACLRKYPDARKCDL